jgi:hypothetical protein
VVQREDGNYVIDEVPSVSSLGVAVNITTSLPTVLTIDIDIKMKVGAAHPTLAPLLLGIGANATLTLETRYKAGCPSSHVRVCVCACLCRGCRVSPVIPALQPAGHLHHTVGSQQHHRRHTIPLGRTYGSQTFTHAFIHLYINTYIRTYLHTYICMHTYILHGCIHMHAYIHAHTRSPRKHYACACAPKRPTCLHLIRSATNSVHAHVHTHTHTHRGACRARVWWWAWPIQGWTSRAASSTTSPRP